MIVHTAQPALYETPIELLRGEHLTPTPLLFVRNNTQPAAALTIKPLPLAGWKIELAGLVESPQTIDAASLADMEHVEREMVLQCSGNGRSLFSQTSPVEGTPWGNGAMGNVRFTGVPLAKLLERAGVRVQPAATFVTAAGADDPAPGTQDFEHSLPLAEALARSLVAVAMNGQPLPGIHGGPVRLVTPGYYGTMHIKWLNRLSFDSGESMLNSHLRRYRTPLVPIKPGQPFESNLTNSEANWRMRMKSVVLTPKAGAELPAGEIEVSGVAFNDGEARIDMLLVSPDAGQSWQRAALRPPADPCAWYEWTTRVHLPRGKAQLWARAIDALGRSQPFDGSIFWNPHGYTWNGVEKIDVTVV